MWHHWGIGCTAPLTPYISDERPVSPGEWMVDGDFVPVPVHGLLSLC